MLGASELCGVMRVGPSLLTAHPASVLLERGRSVIGLAQKALAIGKLSSDEPQPEPASGEDVMPTPAAGDLVADLAE